MNAKSNNHFKAIVLGLNPNHYNIVRNTIEELGSVNVLAKRNNISNSRLPFHFHQFSSENEELLLQHMLEISEGIEGPISVIPATDAEVLFLNQNRDKLSKRFTFCLASDEVLSIVTNKFAIQDFLIGHGFKYPQAHLVDSHPASEKFFTSLSYPCIMKPVYSNEWKTQQASSVLGDNKAIIVSNYSQLVEAYARVSSVSRQVIVQKIIEQKDLENYSFCSYSDRNGKILHGFVTQKLIQYPDRFGTALLCRVVENKRIFEYGSRVINALKYDGIAETEIIVEAGTDDLYVIEINPRHWMQHRLSTRLGVNYTLLDIYYRLGMQDKVDEMLSRHSKNSPAIWIDDVGYMIFALKNMLHPGKYFLKEVISSQREYSLFSAGDWRPFWHTLKSKFKRI